MPLTTISAGCVFDSPLAEPTPCRLEPEQILSHCREILPNVAFQKEMTGDAEVLRNLSTAAIKTNTIAVAATILVSRRVLIAIGFDAKDVVPDRLVQVAWSAATALSPAQRCCVEAVCWSALLRRLRTPLNSTNCEMPVWLSKLSLSAADISPPHCRDIVPDWTGNVKGETPGWSFSDLLGGGEESATGGSAAEQPCFSDAMEAGALFGISPSFSSDRAGLRRRR